MRKDNYDFTLVAVDLNKEKRLKSSDCGASGGPGPGGGGFREGNDCAGGSGGSTHSEATGKYEEEMSYESRMKHHLRGYDSVEEFVEAVGKGDLTQDDYDALASFVDDQWEHAAEDRRRYLRDTGEFGDEGYKEANKEQQYWNETRKELVDQAVSQGHWDRKTGLRDFKPASESWPKKKRPVPNFTGSKIDGHRKLQADYLRRENTLDGKKALADVVRENIKQNPPESYFKGQSPTIHMTPDVLKDVMQDNAILPVGHPDVSSPKEIEKARVDIEKRMGVGVGSNWKERPIYASVTQSEWDGDSDHGMSGLFGGAQVILKDEVYKRSSVTFGDSANLGRTRDNETTYAVPVPYSSIADGTASESELIAAHSRDYAYSIAKHGNPIDSWTELQIWGGVTLADISKVRLSPSAIEYNESTNGSLVKLLKKNGIKVEYAEVDWPSRRGE